MRISPRHTISSKQLSPQEYEKELRRMYSGFLTEDEIQDVLQNPPKLTEAQKKPHSFSLEDNPISSSRRQMEWKVSGTTGQGL